MRTETANPPPQRPPAPRPLRAGSVPYLNAVPLTFGLDVECWPPSELALKLRRGDLDAGLVSVTEPLFHEEYDILDGVGVCSRGAVQSVFLAHHGPLEKIEAVHCDRASLTSVNLLRVLLAERGIFPEFSSFQPTAGDRWPRHFLLIGDAALEFLRQGPRHDHVIWDLGAAWTKWTGLPFVYAVWALRRGATNPALRSALRHAKEEGARRLDEIIAADPRFDSEFRNHYLKSHIHYDLGPEEKLGLQRFSEALAQRRLGAIFPPRFVA